MSIARLNRDITAGEIRLRQEKRITAEIEKQAKLSAKPGLPPPIPQRILNAPAREAERRRNARNGAIGSGLIGGFFPLLFGQGIGSAIGGAAGGFLGPQFLGPNGGFAGGVVGTFVGAQFDAALQRLDALGNALSDPIKNFDALREAALLSSRSIERNVESLIAAGRAEEAAAVARADLSRFAANAGDIQALATAQDNLRRSWAELTTTVAAFTAGSLARLLQLLNGAVQGGVVGVQVGNFLGNTLNPVGGAINEITRTQNTPAGGGRRVSAAALERQRAAIASRATQQTNAEYRAALAAAQGYRKLALAREDEASKIRERNRLNDPSIQGDAKLPERLAIIKEEQDIRRKNALELIRIEREEERERKRNEADKAQEARRTEAANARRRAEVAREQEDRLRASRDELRLAQRLAGTRGLSRDVIGTENEVLGAAQARERAFAALREAENGGAASVDIARLRADFQIAGDTLNRAIIEGGDRLVELSRQAARNLRDARAAATAADLGLRGANTSLAATRSDPNGIGRFLNDFQNNALQASTLRNLLPTFQRNFSTFVTTSQRNGAFGLADSPAAFLRERVNNFARGDFNDPTSISTLLRDVLEFNRSVENDANAQTARDAAQLQLIAATTELRQAIVDNATAQAALATATGNLANKDWTVVVQPPLAPAGNYGIQ